MSEHVLTDTFFENLELHPLLQQGLKDCGFTRCTPIQALTLPVALTGRDVAGQAQTGTGKTCAFLVALMNRLLTQPALADRKDTDPRALVIAPTRELAIQIEKDAAAIGRHSGLRMALIYGGVDYDKQRQQLRDGCDIVIATPGRLLDYYKQHIFSFNAVEVMVIDEADRMFDLGFIKDVRYIFRRLPPREQRQVLLFSATLSHRVLELAYEHMNEAEKLVVETDNVTADKVRQVMFFPAKEEKMPLLLNLLEKHKPQRSIIFANTKAAVERITDRLKRHGFRVGALSGDVPQVKRQKLLGRFQDGQIDMLVATDVAARGLHIPAVSHVFNYDLPQDAEDYVHRIGRTARLGAEGDAISFACDLYAIGLPDIEAYIEQKIPVEPIDPAMLVMPRPRPQAANENDADDEDTGADSHGGKAGGEARGDGTPRKRRRRGGSRSRGDQGGSGSAASSTASSQDGGHDEAAGKSADQGSGSSFSGGAAQGEGAPRKRRRRGGRRRGGQGTSNAAQGEHAASRTSSENRTEAPKRPRNGGSNRRPSEGGKVAGNGSRSTEKPARRSEPPKAASAAARDAAATAPAKRKPGLLKRITGALFGSD